MSKIYKFYILNIYSFIICHLYLNKGVKKINKKFVEWWQVLKTPANILFNQNKLTTQGTEELLLILFNIKIRKK